MKYWKPKHAKYYKNKCLVYLVFIFQQEIKKKLRKDNFQKSQLKIEILWAYNIAG